MLYLLDLMYVMMMIILDQKAGYGVLPAF